MTNLYFVRHAHSNYTPDEMGRPLSEKGFEDAKRITEFLKRENIDEVISSPYKRAIQTVTGIAQFIEKEIILIDDFKERLLSSKSVVDFQSAITTVWEDFNFSLEGGESSSFAQKRGTAVTHKILEEYKGSNIVIGTHGNLMSLIMNFFDRKYNFQFWKELDMPDIYKLTFDGDNLIQVKKVWKRE